MERNEILAHIKKAQMGDQISFNVLKEQYRPLIDSCARRRLVEGMNSQDVEDLSQEALVNFCRAVSSYDLDGSGVEFGLYARICIDNGLVTFIRSYMRENRKVTVSLDDGGDAMQSASEGEDFLESLVEREKAAELVRKVRKNLSEYENKIWWLYVSGKSVASIAKEIGAPSAKSVSNAIYRIRKKLRDVVGENNFR